MQLIDGTRFFQKMKKSLNNKRNELSEAHIARLTEIYGNFRDGERETVLIDGTPEERVVSRIFENREFGFLKVTVERPLRLNFEATAERIARLDEQSAFAGAGRVEEAQGRQGRESRRGRGTRPAGCDPRHAGDAGAQGPLYGPRALRDGPGCRRQARQAEAA